MSLATRCPACGTVFRVVQDQLKVSEGWVRCGRCDEVFNAIDGLVEVDGAAAGAAAEDAAPDAPAEALAAGTEALVGTAAEVAASGLASDPAWDTPMRSAASPEPVTAAPDGSWSLPVAPGPAPDPHDLVLDHGSPPPRRPDERREPGFDDPLPAGPDAPGVLAGPASTATVAAASLAAATTTAGATPSADPIPTPAFVREADRVARWRRPGRRLALGLAALALALLLAAQAALLWRDRLVAHEPALRPLIESLCALAACRIEPLRRIESLAVQSSALTQLDGTGLYRLALVVQNRAPTAVRVPALDVSLTDARGGLVARRVFTAQELGQPAAEVPAASELPLRAVLSTGGAAVSGYSVELFYP